MEVSTEYSKEDIKNQLDWFIKEGWKNLESDCYYDADPSCMTQELEGIVAVVHKRMKQSFNIRYNDVAWDMIANEIKSDSRFASYINDYGHTEYLWTNND